MALVDNLVAYWSLDEASGNATDSHGSNTLTDNGTVGSTTGKVSGARTFVKANSEFFSIADNAALSVPTTSFTWAMWVRMTDKASNYFFVNKQTFTYVEYQVRYSGVADRFRFDTHGITASATADTLGSPSTATWYFIVGWYDRDADILGIQVNNGTVDTAGQATDTNDDTGSLTFGGALGAADFNGDLDEVGFWKRALTSDERTDLYNGGNGRDYAYISGGGGRTTKNTRSWGFGMELGMGLWLPR